MDKLLFHRNVELLGVKIRIDGEDLRYFSVELLEHKGKRVKVLYNPENPDEVEVYGFDGQFIMTVKKDDGVRLLGSPIKIDMKALKKDMYKRKKDKNYVPILKSFQSEFREADIKECQKIKKENCMNRQAKMEYIRSDWFGNHRAKMEKVSEDITVLEWGESGTGFYYIRYVFDRNNVYIPGDLGSAVFILEEKAELERLAQYSLEHFENKKQGINIAQPEFYPKAAITGIREIFEEGLIDYGFSEAAISKAEKCLDACEWWFYIASKFTNNNVGINLYERLVNCGDIPRKNTAAYYVGLKMCWEQLGRDDGHYLLDDIIGKETECERKERRRAVKEMMKDRKRPLHFTYFNAAQQ